MNKVLNRIIGGFVIGVVIGQFVQVIISIGQDTYVPVMDHFLAWFTSTTVAVIVQTILTGMIGITFALSSLLFDIARWSLLKQYIVHFVITSLVWIPIVMLLWIPKSSIGTVIMIISYFSSYVITWISQYFISKKDIQQINATIQAKLQENEED